MTAYLLQRRSSSDLDIKIFEASDRFGGKVLTGRFDSAPVSYEAGTAELYGYAHIKTDPLYNLVRDLGLRTKDMAGWTVILDREILNSPQQISKHLGTKALRAIHDFHSNARRQVSPIEYYNSGWPDENKHPCPRKSFQSLIAKVPSGRARRYLKVAVHSDRATEPGAHQCALWPA